MDRMAKTTNKLQFSDGIMTENDCMMINLESFLGTRLSPAFPSAKARLLHLSDDKTGKFLGVMPCMLGNDTTTGKASVFFSKVSSDTPLSRSGTAEESLFDNLAHNTPEPIRS